MHVTLYDCIGRYPHCVTTSIELCASRDALRRRDSVSVGLRTDRGDHCALRCGGTIQLIADSERFSGRDSQRRIEDAADHLHIEVNIPICRKSVATDRCEDAEVWTYRLRDAIDLRAYDLDIRRQ